MFGSRWRIVAAFECGVICNVESAAITGNVLCLRLCALKRKHFRRSSPIFMRNDRRSIEVIPMGLRELRDRLNALNKKMRAIHDAAEKEDRGLTADESQEWDRLTAEHSDLSDRIKRAERVEANKPADQLDELSRDAEDRQRFEDRRSDSDRRNDNDRNPAVTPADYTQGFAEWAQGGQARSHDLARRVGFNPAQGTVELRFDRGQSTNGIPHHAPRDFATIQEQSRARQAIGEQRAQAVGTAGAGGNVVPDEMMRAIDIALLQWGGMRQVSTILATSTGADLPIPTSNDTGQVGELLGENTQVNEQDVTFGQTVLQAFKYSSKLIRVSVELMQDSYVNLPSLLGSMLGERIGRITNTHFTVGTGSSQPRGIVTAAANSSVTTASNTAFTYSEILALKHAVNPAYREGGRGRWMMADASLLIMKNMKDSQGRPLWLPSLIPGEPSTFDGDLLVINQDMPTGAAAKAVIYGDFSKYHIRDTHSIELMRLDERYADYHQVAFLGFGRFDGDLIDAGTNPVKYLTTAA